MEPRLIKIMGTYLPQEVMWLLLVMMALSAVLFILMRGRQKAARLPPGPAGLPLVGFMPYLSRRAPYKHMDELRKTYGNVFGMYMGSEYYLILGDVHSVREAFNMTEFTRRPEGCFQIGDDCANFASTSGSHWVDHRRLAMKYYRQQLVNFEQMESNILETIEEALNRLESERCNDTDDQVVLRKSLTDAVNRVSFGILCKTKSPLSQQVLDILSNYQMAFGLYSSSLNVERFLPWLKPLLFKILPSRKRLFKAFQEMETYCWSEIESREREDLGQSRDFVDCYLSERKKPKMEERLKRADLNGDMQMIMFASGDTVRSTTEWFLLTMAEHQEEQEKVYREINDVLGSSTEPSYEQRKLLPYTEAVILESMRYQTLVPLNPMHGTANGKPTRFRNYDVPGGAIVIANLWSILHDPNNWSHPHEFHPEHFLTEDGKSVVIPDTFVPFGIGKRICIGDKLALVAVFLMAVRFIQRFKVLPPTSGLKLDPHESVTFEPAFPIVRLLPRI